MIKLNLLASCVAFGLFFTACADNGGDNEKNVVVTIYPDTGYSASLMSDIITQPLVFSDNDDNQKQLMQDIIVEGYDFDYERGYEYKYAARKVWMQEPPQDVSSVKYVFVALLSKTKVVTSDSNEELSLQVMPGTVKFSPRFPMEYDANDVPVIYDALHARLVGSNDWLVIPRIDGFNYTPGNTYELRVSKQIRAEPYSVNYVLLEVLSVNGQN